MRQFGRGRKERQGQKERGEEKSLQLGAERKEEEEAASLAHCSSQKLPAFERRGEGIVKGKDLDVSNALASEQRLLKQRPDSGPTPHSAVGRDAMSDSPGKEKA